MHERGRNGQRVTEKKEEPLHEVQHALKFVDLE